ncbi:divalent-cation tolerance protein CutA [Tahibacter amnicola]|uniref:Divalent-cation tolerance protein CutA n=1 Tax=Tahibacter amnicola TaxID=2976241 RepID=A0ABY6BH09_9GAMM|nr:divalent-cation tolerance protein CutA [Tahibacter amnicola]UXI68797.1 divalent-cation tolerance protein CutA [Tahibacter amnicola]
MSVLIAYCTVPDAETAGRIAGQLVQERLAACVNSLPGVASTYVWEGRLCRDAEHLLLIKTTRDQLPALTARLVALHPYELPEVIAVDVAAGNPAYLDWVARSVGPAPP